MSRHSKCGWTSDPTLLHGLQRRLRMAVLQHLHLHGLSRITPKRRPRSKTRSGIRQAGRKCLAKKMEFPENESAIPAMEIPPAVPPAGSPTPAPAPPPPPITETVQQQNNQ